VLTYTSWLSKVKSMAVLTFANEAFPPQDTGFSEVVASPSVYMGKIDRKEATEESTGNRVSTRTQE
jgi:hypothetical protein